MDFNKIIKCCTKHLDYATPLLQFKKEENILWCPHCNAKFTFFDDVKKYPTYLKLELRKRFFTYLFEKNNGIDFNFYQRPDNVFISMSDADIALTMFNLGYRYKPEELVDGSVLYTLTKNKITVVNLNGVLCIQNQEKTQTKLISDIKGYDLALLPDADFVSNFFIKAMEL